MIRAAILAAALVALYLAVGWLIGGCAVHVVCDDGILRMAPCANDLF